jgi:DNA polymerase-3 subunit gamma/tau
MASMAETAAPYRVLARKYRPERFEDLIGQEAMVQTLRNAFAGNRIHQAYLFTGVRGVGKTTTARIIARGLNYEPMAGPGAPTVDIAEDGRHCRAIIESRHIDVIEMDAASNTGIDDVREIIEAAKYRPASARYKVYIIDEVHMLSRSAFNGLLKTLEEPPEHVKFLFATTEVRELPVTVLSRCQRFDLRRIESTQMIAHLQAICLKEQVTIDEAALTLIVRAGEGSVRDSLSLLDQAIAHGNGVVEADSVRQMLGLADKGRLIDLFESVMRADMPKVLAEVQAQHRAGADPASLIADLADYVHYVTRLRLAPQAAQDPAISETERVRGQAFARDLSMRSLTRAWQILSRGLADVKAAHRPLAAAEMLLVKLAFAADLPTPDEALKLLRDGAAVSPATQAPASSSSANGSARASASAGTQAIAGNPSAATPLMSIVPHSATPGAGGAMHEGPAPAVAEARRPDSPSPERAPQLRIDSFEALVALADAKRDIAFKVALESDVRLVRFEDGRMEFALAAGANRELAHLIGRRLNDWTGTRWMVAVVNEPGQPTLRERKCAEEAEQLRGVRTHALVRAALKTFPGADIVAVHMPPEEPQGLAGSIEIDEDGDIAPIETVTEDDL